MRKHYPAILALPVLIAMSSEASAQVCALGLLLRAAIVSAQEHRELTQKEAATCGLLIDEEASKATKKKKKVVAEKRQQ